MSHPSSPLHHGALLAFHNRSFSCKGDDQVSQQCIEPDLEVIDLDAAQPLLLTPSKSFLSPVKPPSRGKQTEVDLASLLEKGARLEARLHGQEGEPGLKAAKQVVEQKRSDVEELKQAIEMAAALKNKKVAPADLTKAQISEVRQLARNPPEHVRRALTAIWLVLHSDRFRGKSV